MASWMRDSGADVIPRPSGMAGGRIDADPGYRAAPKGIVACAVMQSALSLPVRQFRHKGTMRILLTQSPGAIRRPLGISTGSGRNQKQGERA